ncbi:MAG: hypothetical protein HC772_03775 [Leptolyngbyaceae cyanobacterium CRU_2_3]|nr:hypothetical protein [Leptolyngbyaceae cyanobacterium CRU_2_3]
MPLSIEGFWERLESVCWRGQAIAQFPYMSSFEFTETGYGIGFALRTAE